MCPNPGGRPGLPLTPHLGSRGGRKEVRSSITTRKSGKAQQLTGKINNLLSTAINKGRSVQTQKTKKRGKWRWYDTELLCSAPVVPGESLKTSITLSFHGWLPVHTNAAPRGRCHSTDVLSLGRKALLKQVKSLQRTSQRER